jgi:hypothetical protein
MILRVVDAHGKARVLIMQHSRSSAQGVWLRTLNVEL